ncbi:hypothetical protein ABW21_db0205509 [Orbilia brochopaga]|nr:hypothetical protein ABW21_db0205509 [Drechslerella brochopaga]
MWTPSCCTISSESVISHIRCSVFFLLPLPFLLDAPHGRAASEFWGKSMRNLFPSPPLLTARFLKWTIGCMSCGRTQQTVTKVCGEEQSSGRALLAFLSVSISLRWIVLNINIGVKITPFKAGRS